MIQIEEFAQNLGADDGEFLDHHTNDAFHDNSAPALEFTYKGK